MESAKKWNALRAKRDGGTMPTMFPEWTVINGIKVLRIENSPFVAVPNRQTFDIINVDTHTLICQTKHARTWLMKKADIL